MFSVPKDVAEAVCEDPGEDKLFNAAKLFPFEIPRRMCHLAANARNIQQVDRAEQFRLPPTNQSGLMTDGWKQTMIATLVAGTRTTMIHNQGPCPPSTIVLNNSSISNAWHSSPTLGSLSWLALAKNLIVGRICYMIALIFLFS
ncbi:hypothetical protein J6590_043576 [Homalodisca vitripennis]|nr:hypothetical protein J6590_043576 [Homalodisca vitripennis]